MHSCTRRTFLFHKIFIFSHIRSPLVLPVFGQKRCAEGQQVDPAAAYVQNGIGDDRQSSRARSDNLTVEGSEEQGSTTTNRCLCTPAKCIGESARSAAQRSAVSVSGSRSGSDRDPSWGDTSRYARGDMYSGCAIALEILIGYALDAEAGYGLALRIEVMSKNFGALVESLL